MGWKGKRLYLRKGKRREECGGSERVVGTGEREERRVEERERERPSDLGRRVEEVRRLVDEEQLVDIDIRLDGTHSIRDTTGSIGVGG